MKRQDKSTPSIDFSVGVTTIDKICTYISNTVISKKSTGNSLFFRDVYGHVTEKMKYDSADRMEQFIKAVGA